LTHPTGHFQVFFFHKNWDPSYRHIYLGHPLKLKGVGANIILGDFIIVTPNEDNEVDDDGVNDPRSRREGKHKKNTSLKKAPLSPQVHAADIPQDSRTHMDKKAKIS
jgi:hypothetical protein